jgi:membrane protease YdiL (CAAX protease family)
MTQSSSQTPRPLLHKIFLTPNEPRLRAGWRLILHTLLLGFIGTFLLLFSLQFINLIDPPSIEGNLPLLTAELITILAATWLARRAFDRRSFRSLGIQLNHQAWKDLGVGFMIPSLLMGVVFLTELLFGWTRFEGWAWQIDSPARAISGTLSGLGAFILVGFSEEILSRGYHLQNLRDGLNLRWALLISSGIFAVLHAANPNSSWISTLGILLAGYFLAYGWMRTGQLWLSIGLHIGWNFFEGTVFGFPVSGLTSTGLIRHQVAGPDLITGGAFGPEAGLIILPAMALGVLLIYLYTRSSSTTQS